MRVEGSVIREQGVTFGVFVVKKQVIDNTNEAADAIRFLSSRFGFIPVVLMAQDYRGTPTYYGRRDIVQFLRNVPLTAIPWKEYELN